jgi:hypothetical protein
MSFAAVLETQSVSSYEISTISQFHRTGLSKPAWPALALSLKKPFRDRYAVRENHKDTGLSPYL